jgi:two-component system chemotaxis response regulator CheB
MALIPPPAHPPRLVVIGASWGGLDAVAGLLDALPGPLAVPMVLVQHRGAQASELARLLGRHTVGPVCEADDKEAISPGRLYVAPPDYHLLVERGRFALSTEAPVRFSRPSIDVLFESAADSYGAAVVGVLLTGANDDGARGLAHIRARGGLVLVQDPATAARSDMPRAAIARLAPDLVAPLPDLSAALVELCGVQPAPTGPPERSGQLARTDP